MGYTTGMGRRNDEMFSIVKQVSIIFLVIIASILPFGFLYAQNINFEIDFEDQQANANAILKQGTLVMQVNPIGVVSPTSQQSERIPLEIRAHTTVLSGNWLIGTDASLNEYEEFVKTRFESLRSATAPQDFENLYDPQAYTDLLDSINAGRVNLQRDRQLYQDYDNIRALAVIYYGEFLLIYTQFRNETTLEAVNSIQTTRRYENRIVTAGGLSRAPDFFYRSLVNGETRKLIFDHFESMVLN